MLGETPRWQQLVTLAPVFVIGVGLVLLVFALLARAFADSVRGVEHKNRLWAGGAVLLVAVVVLTYFGVTLPKEG